MNFCVCAVRLRSGCFDARLRETRTYAGDETARGHQAMHLLGLVIVDIAYARRDKARVSSLHLVPHDNHTPITWSSSTRSLLDIERRQYVHGHAAERSVCGIRSFLGLVG